jgi:hypothetical protein
LRDLAKLLEKTLSRPKGDGPWTLTLTYVSAPGVSDPELLKIGLDAVWKRLRELPVVYSYEDHRKGAKDGQAAPE